MEKLITIFPIETAPTDGRIINVSDGDNTACAFYIDGPDAAWNTVEPFGDPLVQPIGFEPTHWTHLQQDFLG